MLVLGADGQQRHQRVIKWSGYEGPPTRQLTNQPRDTHPHARVEIKLAASIEYPRGPRTRRSPAGSPESVGWRGRRRRRWWRRLAREVIEVTVAVPFGKSTATVWGASRRVQRWPRVTATENCQTIRARRCGTRLQICGEIVRITDTLDVHCTASTKTTMVSGYRNRYTTPLCLWG